MILLSNAVALAQPAAYRSTHQGTSLNMLALRAKHVCRAHRCCSHVAQDRRHAGASEMLSYPRGCSIWHCAVEAPPKEGCTARVVVQEAEAGLDGASSAAILMPPRLDLRHAVTPVQHCFAIKRLRVFVLSQGDHQALGRSLACKGPAASL